MNFLRKNLYRMTEIIRLKVYFHFCDGFFSQFVSDKPAGCYLILSYRWFVCFYVCFDNKSVGLKVIVLGVGGFKTHF